MLWAKYVGTGNFSGDRWGGEIAWSCDAYWADEYARCPSVLLVTLKTQYSGALLQDARLEHFEGLLGSKPSFTMSDRKRSKKFAQRSSEMSLTLRLDGFQDALIILSGDWCEKSLAGQTKKTFTLQGSLVEQGEKTISPHTVILEAKCNVQHLAISLEPLLKRLADGEILAKNEAKNLQDLISSYCNGSCGTQQCRPVNCALRQQPDWLTYLGYKDLRDALDFEKSGLDANPPKLKRRPGVETLKITGLKRPGHYTP